MAQNNDFLVKNGIGVKSTATIFSVAQSTSPSTGALIVKGGAGIAGNLYAGGQIISSGTVTVSNTTVSSSPSTGALIVAGGAGIAGNLYVGGQIISAGGTVSTDVLNFKSYPNITGISTTMIGSFPIASYRSAKFIIQISDLTPSYQVSEILLLAISAGTTPGTGVTSITEYAVLTSDAVLGDFSADIQSDGIVRLYLTTNTLGSRDVNVSVQLMKI